MMFGDMFSSARMCTPRPFFRMSATVKDNSVPVSHVDDIVISGVNEQVHSLFVEIFDFNQIFCSLFV